MQDLTPSPLRAAAITRAGNLGLCLEHFDDFRVAEDFDTNDWVMDANVSLFPADDGPTIDGECHAPATAHLLPKP